MLKKLHSLQALPEPNHEERVTDESTTNNEDEKGANNYERVRAYLELYPHARVRDVAEAPKMSVSTANKWMNRVRGHDFAPALNVLLQLHSWSK